MEPPHIILMTNKQCGHCIAFRGQDGIPSPNKPWNYTFIKKLLERNRAIDIIEINVNSMSNRDDNIAEINIYSMISVDTIIRISIKRGGFNIVDIDVHLNGTHHQPMTDSYADNYYWNYVPPIIKAIRQALKTKSNIERLLESNDLDSNLIIFIKNNLSRLQNNISLYDQEVMKRYSFPWLLTKIFPQSLRIYEQFYPCWMLISKQSWEDSINNQGQIYARVINHITTKDQGEFKIKIFSKGETIETLLDMYHRGRLQLEYNESQETSKIKFSWQEE